MLLSTLLVGSCSDSEEGSDEALRSHLRAFDSAASQCVDSLVALAEQAERLAPIVDGYEWDTLPEASWQTLDEEGVRLEQIVAALEPAVASLQEAEQGIEAALAGGPGASPTAGADGPKTGFIAAIEGLFEAVFKVKATNEAWTNARNKRWEGMDDLASGGDHDAAVTKINEGKQGEIGAAKTVTTDLVARTTATMVTAGIPLLGPGTLIIKVAAGQAWQKGFKVLAGTDGCGKTDASNPCIISAGETDDDGKASLPAGTNSVAVSGGDRARCRRDDVPISEGGETTVTCTPIPIDEATTENVTSGNEVEEPEDTGGPAWLICNREESMVDYYACIEVEGGTNAWMDLSQTQKDALCSAAGYTSWAGEWISATTPTPEADCRARCQEMSETGGQYYVCDTPP